MFGPRIAAPLMVVGVLTLLVDAHATDCTPTTRQSTCFDADGLWLPAATSSFIGIPSARATREHDGTIGIDATYLSHPVVLSTRSPAPQGRDVNAVDDVLDGDIAGAYSPAQGLELTGVLPFAAYRTGSGMTGITSQDGPGLQPSALRDVRLGAGYALGSGTVGTEPTRLSAMTRLQVALPLGSSATFAGERGPVVAPSFGFELRHGVFFAAAEEAFRFRESVELGGVRLGTQFVSTLGVGASLLREDRLSLALEGWLMPSLVSGARTSLDGTRVDESLFPAEWMASVRTRVHALVLAAGGGASIPFSSETRTTPEGTTSTTHFSGLTSPSFRFTLVLRYEFGRTTSTP